MKRKDGFYRVKLSGSWEIAQYIEGQGCGWGDWSLCGCADCYRDRDFDRIDDEPVSAVPGDAVPWGDDAS